MAIVRPAQLDEWIVVRVARVLYARADSGDTGGAGAGLTPTRLHESIDHAGRGDTIVVHQQDELRAPPARDVDPDIEAARDTRIARERDDSRPQPGQLGEGLHRLDGPVVDHHDVV